MKKKEAVNGDAKNKKAVNVEVVVSTIAAIAGDNGNSEKWHETDSIYQGIIFACLRLKQLNKGANPRIAANARKRKNTSIAVEEVKQGLVNFEALPEEVI
jgi:DNA-directed RNA polymerase subunit K/omega